MPDRINGKVPPHMADAIRAAGSNPDRISAVPLGASPREKAAISLRMMRRADAVRLLAGLIEGTVSAYPNPTEIAQVSALAPELADCAVYLIEELEKALDRKEAALAAEAEEEAQEEADAGD